MTTARIKLPPKLVPVFSRPRGSVQYRALHGGRGSGKSQSAALMAAVMGYAEPLRILCTREFQVSIKESFHAELKAAIESIPWLAANYDVGVDYIKGRNGTEFIFRGLRRNEQSIKSLAKVDLTIVEEAEDVPETAWLALEATVLRNPGSEIWAIWNPRVDGSPVDQRFIKSPPANAMVVELNWQDNPFFPAGLDVLRRRDMERIDPATYSHIWDGQYLKNSKAQVFANKWRVESFESTAHWEGPYYGLDFGFSQDPTAAVKCWIHKDVLYVEQEVGGIGIEIDATAKLLTDAMTGIENYTVRADNARPESISYLKRKGIPKCIPVKKWPGSVEDSISHMRGYIEIVVHPRCTETRREFTLYSYKVDRNTGDVLPDIIDAHNHYIDAIRYAIEPMIKRRTAGVLRGKNG